MVHVVPLSCWSRSWVLRAIRALKSVGSAMASSRALVCRLWVWPCVAAIASMHVRPTLLNTSWAVRLQPLVWQCVRRLRLLGFCGSKSRTSRAHRARAARILATSMKKFIPIAQKKLSRGAKWSMSRPARDAGAEVLHAVGQRVGELEVGGRPGLLHVVAGDRDRVEPRHVLGGVAEDVADDPHARRRRVDVGVADHELLEDVVLDGPRELLGLDPLLLGRGDVERHDRQHRAVHGHADAHLVERDAVEQSARVVDRVDRHAGHPDVAAHPRVVGVVAAVGGQVEGDAEPLLPGREVAPVERVGLLGGGEAGVLPDRPGLGGVHRRVGPAEVRREAGPGGERVEALEVVRVVARLDLDALGDCATARCSAGRASALRWSSLSRPRRRSGSPAKLFGTVMQRLSGPGQEVDRVDPEGARVVGQSSAVGCPPATTTRRRARRAQGSGGRLAPLGVGRVGAGQAHDALAVVGRDQVVDPGGRTGEVDGDPARGQQVGGEPGTRGVGRDRAEGGQEDVCGRWLGAQRLEGGAVTAYAGVGVRPSARAGSRRGSGTR